MDLRQPLAELVARVPGAFGAILVDKDGEDIVLVALPDQTGVEGFSLAEMSAEERIKLIGAYHTITLRDCLQLAAEFRLGQTDLLVHRYEAGSILIKAIKGGYALMLVLQPDSVIGRGLFHLNETSKLISEDL